MQTIPTNSDSIHDASSTVTAKGQVTIPLSVRRVMGVKPGDQILFHMEGESAYEVSLSIQPTLTLEETFASVQPIQRPEDFKRLRDLAIEEKVEREVKKMNREA